MRAVVEAKLLANHSALLREFPSKESKRLAPMLDNWLEEDEGICNTTRRRRRQPWHHWR